MGGGGLATRDTEPYILYEQLRGEHATSGDITILD